MVNNKQETHNHIELFLCTNYDFIFGQEHLSYLHNLPFKKRFFISIFTLVAQWKECHAKCPFNISDTGIDNSYVWHISV